MAAPPRHGSGEDALAVSGRNEGLKRFEKNNKRVSNLLGLFERGAIFGRAAGLNNQGHGPGGQQKDTGG